MAKIEKRKKLTRQDVLAGINRRADVALSAYDGAVVTVRPLRDSEMMSIFTGSDQEGVDFSEFDPSDESSKNRLVAQMMGEGTALDLMRRVAKVGIVVDDPEDDISDLLDDLIGMSVIEIGMKILDLSAITEGDVEGFFGRPTAKLSSGSGSEDIGSEGPTRTI
jgi:hypothetical protein